MSVYGGLYGSYDLCVVVVFLTKARERRPRVGMRATSTSRHESDVHEPRRDA